MPKALNPPVFEYSAGGLVLHEGKVLLIRARNLKGRSIWTFPKGKLNPSEKSPQAAIREVEEETGWRCHIQAELVQSRYWFQREGRRVNKTVRWFHMSVIELVGKPDSEVDEAAWVPVSEALGRLTYDADKTLLRTVAGASEANEDRPRKV